MAGEQNDPAYAEASRRARAAYLGALGVADDKALVSPIIAALHAYAQATGCPPGGDVVSWFATRWRAAADAHSEVMRKHFATARKAGGRP